MPGERTNLFDQAPQVVRGRGAHHLEVHVGLSPVHLRDEHHPLQDAALSQARADGLLRTTIRPRTAEKLRELPLPRPVERPEGQGDRQGAGARGQVPAPSGGIEIGDVGCKLQRGSVGSSHGGAALHLVPGRAGKEGGEPRERRRAPSPLFARAEASNLARGDAFRSGPVQDRSVCWPAAIARNPLAQRPCISLFTVSDVSRRFTARRGRLTKRVAAARSISPARTPLQASSGAISVGNVVEEVDSHVIGSSRRTERQRPGRPAPERGRRPGAGSGC